MPTNERTDEQEERTELDRVIDYCEALAREARRAKAKGGPATLQALSLHRIACALEGIQEETIDEMHRQAAALRDDMPGWAQTPEERESADRDASDEDEDEEGDEGEAAQ
jgi:hypothetical protein